LLATGTSVWSINRLATTDNFVIRRGNSGKQVIIADPTGKVDIRDDLRLASNLLLTSSSPVQSIGDGTGSPALVLSKSDAGSATINFQSNGVLRGAFTMDPTEKLYINRYGGGGDLRTSAIFDDNVTLPGSLLITGTNSQIILGDGLGSPDIIFKKADSSSVYIDFRLVNTQRWLFGYDDQEYLTFKRLDSGGNILDDSFRINPANGLIEIANNMSLTGSSPTLTVGTSGAKIIVTGSLHTQGISMGYRSTAADQAITLATTDYIIELNSSTGTKAITMTTSGITSGQKICVYLTTATGGSYTLSVTRGSTSGTATLDAVGEGVIICYSGAAWKLLELTGGATFA
jgi:hypothetical protein